MGKVVLDMSMSLDGFVGGRNGDDGLHNWVFGGSVPVDAGGMTFHLASKKSAKVFKEFVQAAGAFIIGKTTFAGVDENPAFQKPTFVLTHEARTPLNKQGTTITFVTDGIESALKHAKAAAGDKDIYVFGGAKVAQQYLGAGLIDEMQINLVPILIGGGLRLFGQDGAETVELESIRVVEAEGVTHLKFRVVK
jgi:dihydrofolate reductase